MYEKDYLKEYIEKSELRIFSNNIKVRLSKELSEKYDKGIYNNYLINIEKNFKIINSLNIIYPGNAKPILYIYIVPDDNYSKLLGIPKIYDNGKCGGKPVNCFDIDGFNRAYGLSQNILENTKNTNESIMKTENELHELSHIVQGQFYMKNQIISEGFAEALPLYALEYEDKFIEHKEAIINLKKEQLLSPKELLIEEKEGTFGAKALIDNKSCTFRLSYISSYLFVRGCIESIKTKYNLSISKSVQFFLEMIKQSNCFNEWLIYDIANNLDIKKEELLNEKQLQINTLKNIK